MPHRSNKKIVVLCDFDGTIIENDGCDILMDRFGPSGWTNDGELFLAGSITHGEMNDRFVANLSGARKEMELFVQGKAIIRQGFEKYYHQLQKLGLPLVVISGGWDLYIQTVLTSLNLRLLSSKNDLLNSLVSDQPLVPLISNKIVNRSSIDKWRIEPLWADHGCQLSTPCKGVFAQHLKDAGFRVVIIGNSETDICMAEKADIVFATGSLPKYLDQKQIPYTRFTTFDEVGDTFKRIIR